MGRLNTKKAAERLGFFKEDGTPASDSVRKLASLGYLKAVTTDGTRGFGKRMFFDAGEIEAFAKGGAPAAQAYRESQERPATVRRGRGGRKVPA